MMYRVVGIAALIGLAAVVFWGYSIARSFNHFREVPSQFNGKCEAVAGIIGPEDLQIDFATGKAFISSFDRRKRLPGQFDSMSRGAIHLFNLENPLDDGSWRDRTGGIPEAFEPKGLHYYADATVKRLFVVNGANNAVELFDVLDDGMLVHLETFDERRMTSPNDVVATGPRSFYVSNDRYSSKSSFRGQISFLMRSRSGKILFFNGVSWHEAANGIQYANGVALSQDGQRFFVAETASGHLIEYDRDLQTGYLTFTRRIPVGAAVDNINIDEGGVLWIGAHPQPLALIRHQRDKSSKAPSTVFAYDLDNEEIQTVYSDDGSSLSGSSTAARLDEMLVIGALYEEKFLICNMASRF